jgi:ribosomal protein S26
MTLNDSWTDLGDGYTCHVDGKNCSIRHGQGCIDTKIYSKVEDYSFDDRHVIAKQNPDYEYYKIFTRSDYCTRFAIYSYYLKDSTSQQFMDDTNPFIRQAIRADSSFYKYLKLKGVTDKNSVQDWEIINPILDSVFKTDPFYKKVFASNENYWIIDKDQNIRYGPLTFNEFDKLRDEKRIDLKFKNEK